MRAPQQNPVFDSPHCLLSSSGRSRFGETAPHFTGHGASAQTGRGGAPRGDPEGERKASREGWWGMRMPCPHSLLKEESR